MKIVVKVLLVFLVTVLIACNGFKASSSESRIENPVPVVSQADTPPSDNLIWGGVSGVARVTISTSEVTVQTQAGDENIVTEYLDGIRVDAADSCSMDFSFAPVSLVSGLLTLDQSSVIRCEPNGGNSLRDERRFTIDLNRKEKFHYSISEGFDLSRPGRLSNLRDVFDDREILVALLANDEIRIAIDPEKKFMTLDELLTGLEISGLGSDKARRLTNESFFGYGFKSLEHGDRVRISLPLIPMGRRDAVEELTIDLPLPKNIAESIRSANKGTEGFLSNNTNEYYKREIRRESLRSTK